VIWKRTVVLFWISIVVSVLLAALSYRDYRERHRCRFLHKSEVRSTRHDVSFQEEDQVGFVPCYVDGEIGFWPKALVISWFILWIAFFSSFAQDVFLYLRGRHNGTIIGSFRWRK
jgi:hypothetical protein